MQLQEATPEREKKSLENLQDYKASTIVQFLDRGASVCVSHLSLVCGGGRVRWEYWTLPPYLSTCLVNPVSLCHSPSLLSLLLLVFGLLTPCECAARSLLFLLQLCLCFTTSPPLSPILSRCRSHPRHPHLSHFSAACKSCYSSASLEFPSARLSRDKTLKIL